MRKDGCPIIREESGPDESRNVLGEGLMNYIQANYYTCTVFLDSSYLCLYKN